MNYRRLLSLATAVLFVFALSYTSPFTMARADEQENDIVVGNRVSDERDMKETDKGMVNEEDAQRKANVYQHDTTTSPYGETYQTWSYAPDIGYGEVGEGYSYTNPLTGETVSYQVTSMGMGSIPLPVYGGMGSEYGEASYGAFSNGTIPVIQSTPGMSTQTSTAGSAYGDGYQYAASQPDPTAIVATSLMQNPSTAGLGYAMAFSAGGFGSFSTPSLFGAPSVNQGGTLPNVIGGTSGIGGLGSTGFSGLGSTSGFGISSGFGGISTLGGLGGISTGGLGLTQTPRLNYGLGSSLYTGGVTTTPSYSSGYAPTSYGAGYTLGAPSYGNPYTATPSYNNTGYAAAPVSTGYVPGYGYQYAPTGQQAIAPQYY